MGPEVPVIHSAVRILINLLAIRKFSVQIVNSGFEIHNF